MPITSAQVAAALDTDFLNLILLPTERCNFRCTYCYEDFKAGLMQQPVIDGVKGLVDRRAPTLCGLEISWFGGEPLLAKPIIYDISAHIVDLTHRFPSLSYAANMTTNGYLLDHETAETLLRLGVNSYQVSLDGPEEIHNRTRLKANGSGSFSQIWANLLAIRYSDLRIHVTLRVHFSPDTVLTLDPLIEAINREFAGDNRFCVYFKSIERLGGPRDSEIRRFSERLLNEAKRHLDGKLADQSQAATLEAVEPYICYASKPNSLVIRSNGDLGKCTVALYDDRNRIGVLKPDGTLSLDQTKLRAWMRGFVALDEGELACPYSAMNSEVKGKQDREDTFPVKFLPLRRKKAVAV